MTVATFGEPFTGTDHDDFAAWARELREYRIEHAQDRPQVMLYDGDWIYRGTVYGENAGSVNIEVNETGTIQLRLPIDLDDPRRTWAAFWALDEESRGTSNIHVRIETMGARVCGRMKARNGVRVVRGENGDEVIIDFLDDIEELKHIYTAGNPFLPMSLIQQPKAWMMLARADNAVLSTLACNMPRHNLANIDVGPLLDLLNPAEWPVEDLSLWQQSQIVVKPWNMAASVAPLALAVGSIRTSIFDVAAPILEDAELQWDLRRWFDGDPEPWPGAGTWWIRSGTLMVGLVDKSAFRTGTSLLGNLATGLTRTIADVTSNYVEDSYDLITGEPIDKSGYRIPGWLDTQAANPYVVYRDGDVTGIQTSEFSRSPGGACRINVGGQSMPGVNEIISAAINYGGDVGGDNIDAVITAGMGADAGYYLSIGSLGGAADAFLQPIYRDSILAYNTVPLLLRAAKQGWGHYLETSSTTVTQAYTAASVMDMRRRRRETDPDISFDLQVANASPWLIGDRGHGHWWLGDRVGGTSKYLMPRVFVRRCRNLSIGWGEGKGVDIAARFGDTRKEVDAIERFTGLIATAMSGLQQIGLW